MNRKLWSMKKWALIWDDEGNIKYEPELFSSRIKARLAQKDMSPRGRVVAVVIREKRK